MSELPTKSGHSALLLGLAEDGDNMPSRRKHGELAGIVALSALLGGACDKENMNPPLSPVEECASRNEAECNGFLDDETRCEWVTNVSTYSGSNSCEPGQAQCVAFHDDGDEGCTNLPVCAYDHPVEFAYYKQAADGTMEAIWSGGSWCGPIPLGWDQCAWEPEGEDVEGPYVLAEGLDVCECACEG